MRCRTARRTWIEVELELAAPEARAALGAHLESCPVCAAWTAAERRLTADLSSLRVEAPVAVDVRGRVVARLGRVEPGDEAPSVRQLAWSTAAVIASGLGLLVGLWRIAPDLPGLAGEARLMLGGLWQAVSGLAAPLAALAATVAKALGQLLASLAPLARTLRELQPVAVGMVALCALMMATSIVLVLGRDIRRPRWIEEEPR